MTKVAFVNAPASKQEDEEKVLSISESVDFLRRDGTNKPIVRGHTKAF